MGTFVKIGEATAPKFFGTAADGQGQVTGQTTQFKAKNGTFVKVGEATAPKNFKTTPLPLPNVTALPDMNTLLAASDAARKQQAANAAANQRELSQIKSELEAAKSAEKSAMGKLDAYMLTYSGALDLRDPAELQILRENAIAATKAREQLEQEYNAHEGSFEDQYGELSSVERAAVGIIGSPFAAVDVIAQTAKSAINGDNTMDMDTLAMQNYKKAQQLKASATENLSGPGKFLADTGISIAQNLYALPMNAVMPGGSLAVMGTTAAADKMAELGDQGESATRSLVRGAISGGIEAATEKIPLDSLADLVKTGGKGVIKNLLKQGGVEATEEGVAYAANYIADKLAKDPNATWDWADFANSVASGGVSGLFFGLGGTAVNRVSNSSINNNDVFLPGNGLETPEELPIISNLSLRDESTQSTAQAPTQTITAPNTVNQGQDTVTQNTAPGGTVEVSAVDDLLSQAVEQAAQSGTVTNSLAERILADQSAVDALSKATSVTIVPSMTKAQQRAAVKNAVIELMSREADASEAKAGAAQAQNNTAPNVETVENATAEKAKAVLDAGIFTGEYGKAFEQSGLDYAQIERALSDIAQGTADFSSPDVAAVMSVLDGTGEFAQESEPTRATDLAMRNDDVERLTEAPPYVDTSVDGFGKNTVGSAQGQTEAALKLDANGKPIGPESSVGAAQAGFDPYSHMINEYGAIPEGENPARIIDVPKSTNGKDKVSMTARTAMEAQATPDSALGDIADAVVNGDFSYIPITNKATAAQAEAEIKRKGFAAALADWTAKARQMRNTEVLSATGALLYNNAINSGDTKTAMSILADYAAMQRADARGLQASRILKTLSPDNKLYLIESTVETLNEQIFGDDSNKSRRKRGQKSTDSVTQAEGEISKAVQDQLDTAYSLIKNIYKAFQDEGKHGVPVEDWMSEVGKLLAEDIARKVSGSTRSTSEPITKTIQKDLLRFARSYLPGNSQQNRQSKRTAADTIRDFFNNRENYAKAWNAAKDAYRAQNGNNQRLMDAAEEWLNGTISYSGDGSDAVILQAIVDTAIDADMTLKDIVTRADLGDLQGAEQELFQRLNAEVGATGADSQALELAVQRHLTEAVQDAGPNSDERIDQNIKATLKDAGLKMSEIIQQNRASKEAAGQKIADMLIQEYGISQEAAETAASIVTERFDSMVKEAAHKKLESIFKERKKSIPKTDRQRLEQFANLGAFESEYNAQAAEKATGYRIEIDQALADEFTNAETDEARDAALDKIIQNIADQVPSGLVEKFNAFRYVNMLGNLKTQVRNVVGNATMAVMRTAKDRIAAGIEAAVYKASGGKFERTKSFTINKGLYKAAWEDYKNVQKLALGEQKYAVTSGGSGEIMNEINNRRTIFKNNGTWGTKPEEPPITRLVRKATDAAWKLPEAYREITNWAMEQGDVIFSHANYTDALAQYLTAHKVTAEQMNAGTVDPELLDNARAYAIREAQRATFRDSNALSQAISEIGFKNADSVPKKLMNTAVQGTLPFRKTPANVLARMEEYSPLGLANTLINGGRLAFGSENVTGADVVDSLAKTLTGSMLWALGLALYHAGRLVVGQNDDDEQAALDALTGGQTYAYVDADGNSYTLDWLSPAASPMFMAAEFAQLGEQNGISIWDLWEAAKTITTPMLEMSMLQGLNDALEDVSYSEDPLVDLTLGGLLDYMTQGLTTTLMSQAERTSDDVRMTTFTDKTSDTPTEVQYTIGSNSAKVPGWDYQQIPYIDAWGRQQEYASLPVRALENFVLPFYSSSKNETEADKEIQRLLDEGYTGVVPSRADKSFTLNGETVNLSADEYVEFATTKGQESLNLVSALVNSDSYKDMSDDEKNKAIELAYTYATEIAKKGAASEFELTKWVDSVEDMGEAMRAAFIIYKARQNVGDVSNSEMRKELFADKSLTATQKQQIDDSLFSDGFYIPKDVNVDYSSSESFTISQMSESAQKRWPTIKEKFSITADQYVEAWSIYNQDGVSATEKKAALRELVGTTQGNRLYTEFGKDLD